MTRPTSTRFALMTGLALLASSVPSSAFAQAVATGDTVSVIAQQAGFIQRRPDTAYDSKSNVYLTVSANPNLRGRFVDGNGTPLGAPFDIDQRGATQQVARVAYSPDAGSNGAFLVTWLDYQQTDRSQVWGRLVAFNTGGAPAFVTTEFMISDANEDVHPEMGAAVEYSTASKVFLTVYRDGPNFDLRGQRVANTGAKVGAEIAVTATPYWEAEPTIAYNPDRDEFMVAYFAEPSDKNGLVMTVPVRASDGALTRGPIAYAGGSFITVPQLAYDTIRKKYLAAHFAFRPGAVFEGRWLLADGTPDPALGIFPLATGYGSYDGFHLVRNTRTESYLGSFHGLDANDVAVEVSAAGTPTAPFRATFSCPTCAAANAGAGTGNFNPRIAASTTAPDWLLVSARSFTDIIGQRFVGKALNNGEGGNGGGGTNGPADTRISIDMPTANATHPQPFAIAGWALDAGSANGTGVNRVDVWAFPTGGGTPTYLGSPTYGTARPDVASAFGSTRFTNSGYGGAIRSLTPGQYTFRTYAFSTVAGQFNNAAEVVATATANPMMFLDLPANVFSTTAGSSFVLAGWSMDTAAGSGTGIDTIHVWAFKDPDTTPVASFIGTATLGGARPDVQNAFGLSSQFANTGFSLTMSLPSAGQWAVIAYGHSSVTNTFVVGGVKRVTIR